MVTSTKSGLRGKLGQVLFTKVAGADGLTARTRIHSAPGPRWFPEGSPIQRVHGDASMFVGGLRALLLQSLHPLAMAGVAGHSGYRGDPWGRLARTSTFLGTTTFGCADDAQAMVDRIRAVHDRVRGKSPDGRSYRASDPELLRWVHLAEIDSFLAAHQRYGRKALTEPEADRYVAQTARVARALGATAVPESTAELADCLDGYRDDLAATDAARDTARFLLHEPPLSWAARGPYALVAAAATDLLPPWARRELGIGSVVGRIVGPAAGLAATKVIRWGLSSLPSPTAEQTA